MMTQLTNGQHASVTVFVADISNIYINLFSLYLMNFIFQTTLDTAGHILRVHNKIMKCDVRLT